MLLSEHPAAGAGSGRRHLRLAAFWLGLCILPAHSTLAASYDFVALESLFHVPGGIRQIHPRAIIVTSSRQRFQRLRNRVPRERANLPTLTRSGLPSRASP